MLQVQGFIRIDMGMSYAISGIEIFTSEKEGARAASKSRLIYMSVPLHPDHITHQVKSPYNLVIL